jgi:hypothetical protein
MKPTEQYVRDAAKQIAGKIIHLSELESQIHQQLVYEGANWAISQMQPEWVSVEDRLPEIGLGGVQILLEDSHSKERFQQTANYDGEWIFLRDPAERVKVVYWHYLLPQPPTK